MGQNVGHQSIELFRCDRLVVVPPDGPFGDGVAYDELVLRRSSGVQAGLDGQRTGGREPAFAALQRASDEFRGRGIEGGSLRGAQRDRFLSHRPTIVSSASRMELRPAGMQKKADR